MRDLKIERMTAEELAQIALGTWHRSEGSSEGFTLYENNVGTLNFEDGNSYTLRTWYVEDGKVKIFIAGGSQSFTCADGTLTDDYSGNVYVKAE